MPSSSRPAWIAVVGIVTASIAGLAQQPASILVTEASLPIYSRTRVLNVFSPALRSQAPLKWSWPYVHPLPTGWLRFRIAVRNVPAGVSWYVVVFDADEGGNEVGRLTLADFDRRATPMDVPSPIQAPIAKSAGPVLEAWTELTNGPRARIELSADGDVGRMSVQIERCNYEFTQPAPKAIVGDDERQDLVRAYGRQHRYYRWSAPIAYLLFQTAQAELESNCTGFLVAPTLVITNNHCVSAKKQLRTAILQFGFESEAPRRPERVPIKDMVYTDYGLDFTLLRLAAAPLGIAPARLEEAPVRTSQRLILIQHPQRQPKTISVTGCAVQTPAFVGRKEGVKSDFLHACDSEGGSSGSPVMDEGTGTVVGLHHLAFFDPKVMDYHNLGVRMGDIMTALRASVREVADEITRAQRGLPTSDHQP